MLHLLGRIETLNTYRLRERMPTNLGEFTVPLGVPEVLRPGQDVMIVTYGACCRIAMEAAQELAGLGSDHKRKSSDTALIFGKTRAIRTRSIRGRSALTIVALAFWRSGVTVTGAGDCHLARVAYA